MFYFGCHLLVATNNFFFVLSSSSPSFLCVPYFHRLNYTGFLAHRQSSSIETLSCSFAVSLSLFLSLNVKMFFLPHLIIRTQKRTPSSFRISYFVKALLLFSVFSICFSFFLSFRFFFFLILCEFIRIRRHI